MITNNTGKGQVTCDSCGFVKSYTAILLARDSITDFTVYVSICEDCLEETLYCLKDIKDLNNV